MLFRRMVEDVLKADVGAFSIARAVNALVTVAGAISMTRVADALLTLLNSPNE